MYIHPIMNTIYHAAGQRGKANFGWLDSRHSFSFGHYYDAAKTNFGLLRVLNDDIIIGGSGFGTHPHDNMEIISIPLSGALEHKDSTGTQSVIHENDVQIMSAGSGISHSEYNHFADRDTNFLQIWIIPKAKNIKPRYDQKAFDKQDRINTLQTVVAPDNDKAVWINQDAWLSLTNMTIANTMQYPIKKEGNGVYVFVINGSITIGDTTLKNRDAIGIWNTHAFDILANTDTELLLIDVPLK